MVRKIVSTITLLMFFFANNSFAAKNNLSWMSLLLGSDKFILYSNPSDVNPFAFVVTDKKSDEKFGVFMDRSGLVDKVAGITYTTPDGDGAVLIIDPATGLPKLFVDYNGYQVSFSNYTETTVQMTLLSPAGTVLDGPITKAINQEEINNIKNAYSLAVAAGDLSTSRVFFSSDEIARLSDGQTTMLQWSSLAFNWVGCGLSVAATWGTFGLATAVAVTSCGAAILSTTSYITQDPRDDALAFGADGGGCITGIALCGVTGGSSCAGTLACISAIIDITTYPTDEVNCLNRGGFWYHEECWNAPLYCGSNYLDLCTTELACSNAGGFWTNSTCTTPNTVVSAGQVWMDRNLGASRVATDYDDSEAYGDLYQWGRGADGHEKRNSPTTYIPSSTDQPGHGSFILVGSSTNYDWRYPHNSNLWQGVNGINTPCPSGFRLPTRTELEIEVASWSDESNLGAINSPLKLPAAGSRSARNNTVYSESEKGYYATSTNTDSSSVYLTVTIGSAYFYNHYKDFGRSVRCIKD